MSRLFDFIAEAIEQQSSLAKLEARGTLRLALKDSGFNADTVTASDMAVVLERLMPRELTSRGVDDAQSLCQSLANSLKEFRDAVEEHGATTPESVFARLAGN
jgi:hypothetical protein